MAKAELDTYESETGETFSSHDFAEAVADAGIHLWIRLKER
jgi:hypothetical protein